MIARGTCLALLVLIAACDSSRDSFMFGPPSRDEVARATSPGGDAISVAGREVTVELHGGVTDPKAPPGGMLYDLQGRPDGR